MQCAKCQATLKTFTSGTAPTSCPHCAAALAVCRPGARPRKPPERAGSVVWVVLFVMLIVALAAVSVGSTIYAIRAIDERDQATEDLAQSAGTLDEVVVAAAGHSKLKGPSAAEARETILRPALDHYEQIIEKYQGQEEMMPAVADAQLRKAALQAKLGMKECVRSLQDGCSTLNQMTKLDFPEESYPSFQASVSRIAEPADWITVKGSSPMAQGTGLYLAIGAGASAYEELHKKFPKSVVVRDNLAELKKSSALLYGFMNRNSLALNAWTEARDVLETLVADKPDDVDFQERLAESLVNAARIENTEGQTDKAIADYKRAIELRQKMIEANPDDKSLEKALAGVQKSLESVEASAASSEDAGEQEAQADEKPAEEEAAASKKEAAEASTDEPSKEEASEGDASDDDAPQQ